MTDQMTAIDRDQRDDTVCARRLHRRALFSDQLAGWRDSLPSGAPGLMFLLIRICGEQIGVKHLADSPANQSIGNSWCEWVSSLHLCPARS